MSHGSVIQTHISLPQPLRNQNRRVWQPAHDGNPQGMRVRSSDRYPRNLVSDSGGRLRSRQNCFITAAWPTVMQTTDTSQTVFRRTQHRNNQTFSRCRTRRMGDLKADTASITTAAENSPQPRTRSMPVEADGRATAATEFPQQSFRQTSPAAAARCHHR